ncbi:hypothetical protein CSB09_01605 [Candidatus Gracilibacteria bacterium]|nr:MAG: hypothetical protein CSB09_01605 [Candidatus Gracilibacteria bacterium]
MDKIQKFLKKLSAKEIQILLYLLEKIKAGDTNDLDTKKLRGRENLYRVRKGKIRIIFRKEREKLIIIDVNYRGGAYKDI